jgi:hypothetical protein
VSKFASFWFGELLPPYQLLAMKSFVDFGHEYALYSYRKFDVPQGVELRDAHEVLPETRVFFYGERAEVGRGSVSAFSNLFRYHLLHRLGGWWVDTDVVCLSETVPSVETFMGWEYDDLIGTAILKFPERHWFVRELRDTAERLGTDPEWGAAGPFMLTRLAREYGLLGGVSPLAASYPVQSKDALQLLLPAHCEEIRSRIRNVPFLHMWNEMFRRAVVVPWMAPPPGSLLAELFERHGIQFGSAPVYTADQVQRLKTNYAAFADGDFERHHRNALHSHQLGEAQGQLREAQGQLKYAWELIVVHEHEIAKLVSQVDAFQASTSWRVTAPIRRTAIFLQAALAIFARREASDAAADGKSS